MSSRFIKWLLFKVFVLSHIVSFSVHAIELGEYGTVSGFVGTGFSYDLGNTDDDYEPLVESGLRSSFYLPHNFMLNGQILYKDVFVEEQASDEFQFDYLTLDWRNLGPWESEQTISLGRFKSSSGIYGNTIDVPFTRPNLVLAQSVYPDQFRSLLANVDGVLLSSNFVMGDGDLTAEIGYGTHSQDEDLKLIINNSMTATATMDMKSAIVFDLKYRTSNWLFAFSYRNMKDDYSVDGGSNLPSFTGEFKTVAYIAGIQYQQKALELTVEGLIMDDTYTGSSAIFNNADDQIKGVYGQIRYFVRPDLALMLRYDHLQYDINNTSGIDVTWLDDYYTWTTGVTWNFSENWQLSLEVHERREENASKTTTIGQVVWRF